MSQRPRRAVVFTGHFLPKIGGVEVYSLKLWRGLIQRGWEVMLVTSNVGGGIPEERMDGIRVLRLPVIPAARGLFPVVLPGIQLAKALRAIEAFRPDVVVTNLRFMPPSWVGAAYAAVRRVPLVHIEHASSGIGGGDHATRMIARIVDSTVGAWVVRGATRTLGVSRDSAAFLRQLGARRVSVLTAGVEPPPHPAETRVEWRQRLGLGPDDLVFVFVGRIVRGKGVFDILESWSKIAPPDHAHLIFAGEGTDSDELAAQASRMPRVRFLGRVEPDDIMGLLSACDVFVHPSKLPEGGPLTVIEAAAAGLAIVATPQGITRELITMEAEGYLVAADDPAGLARTLGDIIADPATSKRKGMLARERALALFGWPSVLDSAEREFLEAQTANG
jgi:glycosyltransferase involved in cell wall biosynthesis